MKTKKLFLIIALVVGCAVGAHAQKTVFKFRDAQARAGDAVTEVCVKPTVVEVKILEDKGRIKDEWTQRTCGNYYQIESKKRIISKSNN